jgi:predicted esterase
MATPTRSVAPTAPHSHTIISLHGRGSNGSVFCDELFESEDNSGRFFIDIFAGIKWVFPTATESYDQSEDESRWFDMSSVQRPQENSKIERLGLWHSVAQVLQVVKTETDIVGGQNVMLAGISQGCAIGIFALLASGMQIGGFIGLSGWLPLAEEVQGIMNVPGRARDVLRTPVLLQHCKDDDVVPVENGNDFRIRLGEIGMCVIWECFEEGGHWLNEPNGMDGLVDFIQAVMEAT